MAVFHFPGHHGFALHGGVDRVAHPRGHRAGDLEILGRDGIALAVVGDDDLADALAQILEIARHGENGHADGVGVHAEQQVVHRRVGGDAHAQNARGLDARRAAHRGHDGHQRLVDDGVLQLFDAAGLRLLDDAVDDVRAVADLAVAGGRLGEQPARREIGQHGGHGRRADVDGAGAHDGTNGLRRAVGVVGQAAGGLEALVGEQLDGVQHVHLLVLHAYFMEKGMPIKDFDKLRKVIQEDIIPLLEEYCYGEYNTIAKIIGSSFVNVEKQEINYELFETVNKSDLISALLEPNTEIATALSVQTNIIEEKKEMGLGELGGKQQL